MLLKSHPAVVTLWRWWLRARFVLTQRHRHNRLVIERIAGRPLVILPEVFNPALFFSSDLLAALLDRGAIPAGARVLDLGTGSGVLAVCAARVAGEVAAVDINPAAVRCARINALLNGVEDRLTVYEGDLFAPVAGRTFDVVLFNPPYFRGRPRSPLDRAFRATDVIERFAAGLPGALAPGGKALLVLSTNGEQAATLGALADQGYAHRPLARRDAISELLTVYEIVPKGDSSHAGAV
ncbi:MAG TPA: HemK2/MTQ2 family protein methyltransferase [Herpetosiphonaceae bacterium]|nr:HemK2/MTQ2 family protein methyltransferase [Herpetosiphonaceae bacterium]